MAAKQTVVFVKRIIKFEIFDILSDDSNVGLSDMFTPD